VLSGFGNIELIGARTLDFSLSGTRIQTQEQLKSNDQLSVRIELPDLDVYEVDQEGKKKYGKTVLMCFGRVRWVGAVEGGGYTAGVWFSGMSVSDRAYLKKLLDEDFLEVKK
jgi:hypothetical protein